MNYLTKNLIAAATIAAASSVASSASYAQNAPAVPTKNVFEEIKKKSLKDNPPILDYLKSSGIKLTYLGDAGGLDGYLGESPTGDMQTFYVTPDGQHTVAGLLFRGDGTNLTGVQLKDMQNRFEAAQRQAKQQGDVVEKSTVLTIAEPKNVGSLQEVPPKAIELGEVSVASSDDYKSDKSNQFFKAEIENSAWFQVGAEGSPVIYMVADPNCPFCHRSWKQLEPHVMNREISVRIILIAGLEGSEADTISILSMDNPSMAWLRGEGSTALTKVAPPPAASSDKFKRAQHYLRRNEEFVNANGVQSTPHFFYFDETGQLYESRGMPKDWNAFTGALYEQ